MSLAQGTRLGPYEIVDPLGAGGMGEVFRARDTRLKRDVAIKILPGQLAEDADALARFEREAQAVAALSHPNILSIHDYGSAEGVTYAVMELLEGETLGRRIQRLNLSAQKAVELALQIANGLAAAHARGVVHRDLKPENIFITTDGLVKILDFGLAKQNPIEMSGGADTVTAILGQTVAGTIVGTLAYMSPEQLRGATVDHRSDIFSFGSVLYEMLAGHLPFRATSAPDLMGAILQDPPADLSVSGVFVSPALQKTLRRCLEKEPEDRFQSARDLAFALESMSDFEQETASGRTRSGAAQVPDAPTSVAALPFTNLSPDPEQEYFCEGMAEEIINALSQIEGLRVAARASAFQFKGKAKDIREVGQALNVQTVLDGSVRTAGKRLRVTVQLIDVDNGFQLWSERYDREMEDVFAIQDEISESIAQALQSKLGKSPAKMTSAPATRHTDSLEAYQLYLKGQHNWYKRESGSLVKAAHFFEQAVERDPNYVLAHTGVANAYSSLAYYGAEARAAGDKARAALDRAVAVDRSLNEVRAALGFYEVNLGWNWDKGEAELTAAIEQNPANVLAHCWLSFLLTRLGRHDESLRMAERALELDPLSSYAHTALGLCLSEAGEIDRAIAVLEEALDLDSEYLYTHWVLGGAYGAGGRFEEAIATLERAVALADRDGYYLSWLGWAYGLAGRHQEGKAILAELTSQMEREYVAPVHLAQVYSGLGDKERALDWWEEAVDAGNTPAAYVRHAPFVSLHSEPRGQALLARLNIPL